jgi:quercetin dioxygenase-like cupin family protein
VRTSPIRPLIAAGIWLSLTAAVQTPVPAEHIDAVKASPANFTLLLENEHVRVIEYAIRPGERDQWHTHPARVSYVVSAGTVRVTTSDGRSLVFEEKAGDTTWSEPAPRHFVENIGPTPVKTILVEVKERP